MTRTREPPPSFLGTGWSFPPSFAAGGAALATVSGVDAVHRALRVLLATRPGERPMAGGAGCDLDRALFAEVGQALVNDLSDLIHDAILRQEPRVVVTDVDVSEAREPGVVAVRVTYTIPGTNSRFNMVFPFNLNEAAAPGA